MDIFTSVFILIVLLALADWIRVKYRDSKYLKGFDGPPHIPLVGRAFDFYNLSLFYDICWKYVLQYKNKIKSRLGPMEFAVIMDPKLIETIMTSQKFLTKSREYRLLENWLGKGLLTSTGERWKKNRKFLTPSFHFNNSDKFMDVFNKNGHILLEKLKLAVGKDEIDIYPLITLYTLDVICESVMGTSVNAQIYEKSDYVKSVKILTSTVHRRTVKIWKLVDFLYPLSKDYWMEKRALKISHDTIDSVITKRRDYLLKNPDLYKDSKKCTSFLDMLLQATIDGRPLTNEEIREQVDTFMLGGHDTTATAICFTLFLLSNNKVQQQKVYEEIRSIAGSNNKNVNFTYDDLNAMNYLSLVIKESLRIFPSIPIIGRTVEEDVEIDGVVFPKGLSVMIPIIFLHRNHEIFEKPEYFIPERFEKENWNRKNIYGYIPFSAGYRNCIGQKFGMLEMKAVLSKILLNFELHPVISLVRLKPDIVLRAETIPVRLTPRDYIKFK